MARSAAVLFFSVCFCFAAPVSAEAQNSGGWVMAQAASEADEEEFMEDLFADEEEEEVHINDPLESYNRAVFWFNDKVYFYAAKPVARVWRVVPERARIHLRNFFVNLLTPLQAINCLLQGKVDDFGNELGRFMTNTTVGILGFSDQAKRMSGIGPKKEDLGQTLGVWGFGQGFYFVLPFLGPSSLRDTTGFVGDYFMDPMYYLLNGSERVYARLGVRAGSYINTISIDKDTYEALKRQAIDPYVSIRNVYAQKRAADVAK